MSPAVLNVLLGAPFNPYRLSSIAARYSLDGNASDSTYLKDGSNRIMLVADRSGNSPTNGLVLNAVAGNYASTPDSVAVSVTGDIDIRADVAPSSWATGVAQEVVAKMTDATHRSYRFEISTTGGLTMNFSVDGSTNVAANSTATTGFAAFVRSWVRVTRNATTGAIIFYTSTDGSTWTQLGTTVTTTTGSIFDTAAVLEVGSLFVGTINLFGGVIYRAQVYNGIAGTLVFDADFSRVAKLAATFSESSSNAATVTINATGDTGARICGARDLYQGTQAKQPIWSVSAGQNIGTWDGSNDYLRSAPFTLVQPCTRHSVLSQVTWTDTDQIWGGNAAGTMGLLQSGITPALVINAGSSVASNTDLATATRAVVSAVYNGASSSLRVNKNATTTGDAGAGNPGGVTLGAKFDGTLPANITWSEEFIRSIAETATEEVKINTFLMKKWGIA